MIWLYSLVFFMGVVIPVGFELVHRWTSESPYWKKRKVHFITSKEIRKNAVKRFTTNPRKFDQYVYNVMSSRAFCGVMECRDNIFFVKDLELVHRILVQDSDHFVNDHTLKIGKNDLYFSQMLNFMEKDTRDQIYKALKPVFTMEKIEAMFPMLNESAEKLVKHYMHLLKEEERVGERIETELNMHNHIGRLVTDMIAKCVFGVESQVFEKENSVFSEMLQRIHEQFHDEGDWWKTLKTALIIEAPALAKMLRLKVLDSEASEFFVSLIKDSLEDRKDFPGKRNDFVQLMVNAQQNRLKIRVGGGKEVEHFKDEKSNENSEEESKFLLTDDQIVSQSILFFLNGHDTTITTLEFAFYELAHNPDMQEKLFQELKAFMKTHNGKLTFQGIDAQLPYLDMFIREVLRKYPVVTRAQRRCSRKYQVPDSETLIEKNTMITIPIYAIHHDDNYYSEPEKFNPERFDPSNKTGRNSSAYMPFGLDPHSCIAQHFAFVEMKTAVAQVVSHFKITPSSKTSVPLQFQDTLHLRPENEIWVSLSERDS